MNQTFEKSLVVKLFEIHAQRYSCSSVLTKDMSEEVMFVIFFIVFAYFLRVCVFWRAKLTTYLSNYMGACLGFECVNGYISLLEFLNYRTTPFQILRCIIFVTCSAGSVLGFCSGGKEGAW